MTDDEQPKEITYSPREVRDLLDIYENYLNIEGEIRSSNRNPPGEDFYPSTITDTYESSGTLLEKMQEHPDVFYQGIGRLTEFRKRFKGQF